MRTVRRIVRIVFLYVAFLLSPSRLLRASRALYFSAPQRNSDGDDSAAVPAPLVVGDDERWSGLAALGGVEDQQKAAWNLAAAFDGTGAVGD